jgi:hypothetical protein
MHVLVKANPNPHSCWDQKILNSVASNICHIIHIIATEVEEDRERQKEGSRIMKTETKK